MACRAPCQTRTHRHTQYPGAGSACLMFGARRDMSVFSVGPLHSQPALCTSSVKQSQDKRSICMSGRASGCCFATDSQPPPSCKQTGVQANCQGKGLAGSRRPCGAQPCTLQIYVATHACGPKTSPQLSRDTSLSTTSSLPSPQTAWTCPKRGLPQRGWGVSPPQTAGSPSSCPTSWQLRTPE